MDFTGRYPKKNPLRDHLARHFRWFRPRFGCHYLWGGWRGWRAKLWEPSWRVIIYRGLSRRAKSPARAIARRGLLACPGVSDVCHGTLIGISGSNSKCSRPLGTGMASISGAFSCGRLGFPSYSFWTGKDCMREAVNSYGFSHGSMWWNGDWNYYNLR